MTSIPIQEIIFRLKNLKPGEKVTYYVGCLASQRSTVGNGHTAMVAYQLYEQNKVHLVQRRLGPPLTHFNQVDWQMGHGPGFEYIAIGAAPKHKQPTFGAHLRSEMEAL